jgi:phage FluMu gp28-like protein
MPSEPYFMDYQREWINDDSRLKIWEKSRRIGATYTESWDSLKWSIKTGRDTWFSSADDSAAKEFIDYIEHWCELLEVVAENMSEDPLGLEDDITAYQVRLPNGAKITAMSSNPKRFRSKGGRVVWDEAAHHNDGAAMWKAMQASAMWGDPIRVLSTHLGNSVFSRLIDKIRAGKTKGSVHTVTIVDAVDDGIVDRIMKRRTTAEEQQAWLDDLKAECLDEDQWLQEYMCVPIDEANAFLSYEMLAAISSSNVLWNNGIPETVSGDLYLGMDIGRKKDLSVIWIVEKIGPMKFTRAVDVMEKTSFRTQKEKLYKYLVHPKLRRGCIDATGLGMQFAEEAQEDFGKYKVEAVSFTAAVKEDIAFGLRRVVEEKSIIIPAGEEIREDLHSVKKVTTSSKNIRFDVDASVTGHADRFWGCALSNHAAKSYAGPVEVASSGTRNAERLMRGFDYGGLDGF